MVELQAVSYESLVCLWTLFPLSVLVELLLWCVMVSDVSISIYEVNDEVKCFDIYLWISIV